MGTQGPVININNNNNNAQNNVQTLTVNEALDLIHSQEGHVPLLEDPQAKEALYLEHSLSNMPEVNATRQTGYDTSKEGLNFNVIADAKMVDEGPNDLEHHNTRREREYDIDLEADEV